MKKNLELSNDELIDFLKVGLIKDYEHGKLVVSIPEDTK